MKKFSSLFLMLSFCLLINAAEMPRFAAGGRDATVWFVPQHGDCKEISSSDMNFLKKTLARAAAQKVDLVVFELDTPGGRVDTALRYVSMFAKSEVPVVAYLNPQGISAGMLIALAADKVAINPNGVIGDAMPMAMRNGSIRPVTEGKESSESTKDTDKKKAPPKKEENTSGVAKELERLKKTIDELGQKNTRDNLTPEEKRLADQKFLTVYFKVLEVISRKNNRPERVVRAMADPYQKLTVEQDQYLHDGKKPLTLSAAEAKRLGVVDYVASTRKELFEQLGCPKAEIKEIRRSGFEQIVDFLTLPAVAGILIALGLVGIYVEITTPGFGVPGILGVAALVLFFAGHAASGASDFGPMVIFFVGLLLIALEVFVIPGFGLVGILGGGCVIWSFFGAFGFTRLGTALYVVFGALSAAIIMITLLVLYVLPKSRLFASLTLPREKGFHAAEANAELIGQRGMTLTPLRPAGTVQIGDRRYDAVSEGDFLERNQPVSVRSCNGFQLVVIKHHQEEVDKK